MMLMRWSCFEAIDKSTDQGLIRLCLTKFVVRGMVPWKSYIEHAIEKL